MNSELHAESIRERELREVRSRRRVVEFLAEERKLWDAGLDLLDRQIAEVEARKNWRYNGPEGL